MAQPASPATTPTLTDRATVAAASASADTAVTHMVEGATSPEAGGSGGRPPGPAEP